MNQMGHAQMHITNFSLFPFQRYKIENKNLIAFWTIKQEIKKKNSISTIQTPSNAIQLRYGVCLEFGNTNFTTFSFTLNYKKRKQQQQQQHYDNISLFFIYHIS